MASEFAIIIPALNEEESIGKTLDALDGSLFRIIVADNGSTDQTTTIAKEHGAEVVTAKRRGYGSAVLAGISHLASSPPHVVVILDADLADDITRIQELIDPIVKGRAELVISDRTKTSEQGALSRPQRFGNALATELIYVVSGYKYRDMGPYRAIKFSSLMQLQMTDPTWGWNVEMQLKAINHGLRVIEIPMKYRARSYGKSKISGDIVGSFRAGIRILQAVVKYRK